MDVRASLGVTRFLGARTPPSSCASEVAWPISVYGVPHIYYNKETKRTHTQFRPVAYMLHATETAFSCTKLLESAKVAVKLVTGYDVQHSTGCTDRAIEQKTGWDNAFTEAVWTTCWPHIARKPQTQWVKRMHDSKYI